MATTKKETTEPVVIPINSVYKKLLTIKKEVPYLQKDKKGFNYTYVTPTAVCATINPLLIREGLVLITNVTDSKSYEIHSPTKNDPNNKEWKFDLEFIFTWVDVETGDRVDIAWKASGVNGNDKGLGSALTYAERYFLLKQFNIPNDNDDPDSFQDKHLTDEQRKNKPKPKVAITDAAFNGALVKIAAGEHDIIQKLKDTCLLTPKQEALLADQEGKIKQAETTTN